MIDEHHSSNCTRLELSDDGHEARLQYKLLKREYSPGLNIEQGKVGQDLMLRPLTTEVAPRCD